jgi:hypothetical protein
MGTSSEQFSEIWIEAPNGSILGALINREVGGWLTYLREAGDAGFGSRNPEYSGPPEEKAEFIWSNGQLDHYPRAWAYPLDIVERAVEHFRATGSPPTFIQWHNDSGDGETIPPRKPRHPGRSARAR